VIALSSASEPEGECCRRRNSLETSLPFVQKDKNVSGQPNALIHADHLHESSRPRRPHTTFRDFGRTARWDFARISGLHESAIATNADHRSYDRGEARWPSAVRARPTFLHARESCTLARPTVALSRPSSAHSRERRARASSPAISICRWDLNGQNQVLRVHVEHAHQHSSATAARG